MADDALNLRLDSAMASRLQAEARAMGLTPEILAADLLGRLLNDPAAIRRPATTAADYAGPYIGLEEALHEFDTELDRRLTPRRE